MGWPYKKKKNNWNNLLEGQNSHNGSYSEDKDPSFFRRNHDAVYPKHKFFFETENHYFAINCQLKPEYRNSSSISDLTIAIEKFTSYSLGYIKEVQADGIANYLYQSKSSNALTPDANSNYFVKIELNYRDKIALVIPACCEIKPESIAENLSKLISTFFLDSAGYPIKIVHKSYGKSADVQKWYLKRKQHQKYNVPHSEAQDSPIEVLFEEELKKRRIDYRSQVNIEVNGKLFTRPDFLIDRPKIAIYCDGITYHNSKEMFIRDRQQDRHLQVMGFIVLRFSGSEIFANPKACVDEVLKLIKISFEK